MVCLFDFIVSDVAEIVITYNRTLKSYYQLRRYYRKFDLQNVKERIFDKLTKKTIESGIIYYKLGKRPHRSFGKPLMLSDIYEYNYVYKWDKHKRHDLPCLINYDGYREYKDRSFFLKYMHNIPDLCYYSLGNSRFYYEGYRVNTHTLHIRDIFNNYNDKKSKVLRKMTK